MIDFKTIKMLSRIGSRAAFGLAALALGENNSNLIVITPDVSTSAGLDRYKKTLSDQFIDTGIAEQNMMGIATGLASEGFEVITTTFAPFQTMRCCEQIRVNQGYMEQKLCMVGLASGIVLGNLGYTHCCIEDVGIIRSIPNIAIISPADCLETFKCIEKAVNYEKSVYIRLTGGANNRMVYKEDYDFEIGKAIELKNGNDIAIIATGTMVSEALSVSIDLEVEGISVTVVNMHTLVPLDTIALDEVLEKHRLIVTLEEHSVVGGLGTAVAEYIAQKGSSIKQLILGLQHSYVKGGDYKRIMENSGLTKADIIEKIKRNFIEVKVV